MSQFNWTQPAYVLQSLHSSIFSVLYMLHYTIYQQITRIWASLYQYICDSSVGVHRYTRWTGRLSHQVSNLHHPCNPLLKGCDPCFT